MGNPTTIIPIVKNQVIINAGGLDIKVDGNTLTFTIGHTNWKMSVAEFESMLESHQLLKDACHQTLAGYNSKDMQEFEHGLVNAKEALRRAD